MSGLALIYLKAALQQAGCPICRCCTWHEERCIRALLWENVNDVGTRVRLAQSLGFCQKHAQQMLQMEQDEFGLLLGNSIIYESLVQLVSYRVRATHATLLLRGSRANWWHRLLSRASAGVRRRLPIGAASLMPEKPCRVCELGDEMAEHYARALADLLSSDPYRALYQQSDGICLPHLRVMLTCAEAGSGLDYVLTTTEERLVQLKDDLEALGRKQCTQYRDEPITEGEGRSVERAIAFLTGSAPSPTLEAGPSHTP